VSARISILWTAATATDHEALDGAARLGGVSVFRTAAATFAASIPTEARLAAVVVVAASSHDATRALALGADEVLRVGEVTPDRLSAAIQGALVRARARAVHRRDARDAPAVDADAFALFVQSMSRELAQSLYAAKMNVGHLAAAVPTVAEVADRLTGWAALVGGTEELRNLVALRATAPPTTELEETLDDMRLCLDALEKTLKAFRAVTAATDRDVTDAGVQMAAVLDLVRGQLEAWADVRVDASPAGLLVPCTPSFFSWVLGTMLDRAVLPWRASAGARSPDGASTGARSPDGASTGARSPDGASTGARSPDGASTGARSPDGASTGARSPDGTARRRGVVVVRALEREGVVVLEVEATAAPRDDQGAATNLADSTPDSDRPLEVVGRALRGLGGDLLVDADGAWSLARAFLPLATPAPQLMEPAWASIQQRQRSRSSN
jgi:hypothetical protein